MRCRSARPRPRQPPFQILPYNIPCHASLLRVPIQSATSVAHFVEVCWAGSTLRPRRNHNDTRWGSSYWRPRRSPHLRAGSPPRTSTWPHQRYIGQAQSSQTSRNPSSIAKTRMSARICSRASGAQGWLVAVEAAKSNDGLQRLVSLESTRSGSSWVLLSIFSQARGMIPIHNPSFLTQSTATIDKKKSQLGVKSRERLSRHVISPETLGQKKNKRSLNA